MQESEQQARIQEARSCTKGTGNRMTPESFIIYQTKLEAKLGNLLLRQLKIEAPKKRRTA
jgi:hypothetical protein